MEKINQFELWNETIYFKTDKSIKLIKASFTSTYEIFIALGKIKIDNPSSIKNAVPDGFVRIFSASPEQNQSISLIEKKIEKIDNKMEVIETSLKSISMQMIDSITEMKQAISKIGDTLTEINKNTRINNSKLCYFIIDLFNMVCPNFQFGSDKIKMINDAFGYHQLGQLDPLNLAAYCTKKANSSLTKNSQHGSAYDNYTPNY